MKNSQRKAMFARLYHGTSLNSAKEIEKNGFYQQRYPVNSILTRNMHWVKRNWLERLVNEGHPIFVTTDPEKAAWYAEDSNNDGAILELDIDPEARTYLNEDNKFTWNIFNRLSEDQKQELRRDYDIFDSGNNKDKTHEIAILNPMVIRNKRIHKIIKFTQ